MKCSLGISNFLEEISSLSHFVMCVCMGYPGGSAGKESACNVGNLGLIPGLGRSPGEGNSCPLQYTGLENPMDCSLWGCKVSDTTVNFHFSLYVCVCVCVCVCIHTILSSVHWTAKRSNHSVLKEINSKYSLEGLMLKVKLQYFGHLMQRANSLEKTLMLKD